MTQILVSLDRSTLAEEALPWAAEISRARKLPVRLVSVYPFEAQAWEMANIDPDNPLAQARGELQVYLDKIANSPVLSGLASSSDIRAGYVASEITAAATEASAEMIVITTHGQGGFDASNRGSVADRLVRTANRPIFIVPPGSGPATVTSIVVCLDGSEDSERAIAPARQLAEAFRAHLHLLFVLDVSPGWRLGEPQQTALEDAVRSTAKAVLARVRKTGDVADIVSGKVAPTIVDYAQENGCEIIVMATHGRSGRLWVDLGSIADRVVRLSDRPVLLIPVRDEDAQSSPSPI